MSDIFDWIQSYWFELGSLTAQFAILAVVVWYARKSLKIQTSAQRQFVPATRPAEAPATIALAEEPSPAYGGVGHVLSAPPAAPVLQAEPVAPPRVKRASGWQAMMTWLRTPWHEQANRRIAPASQRRAEPSARPVEAAASFAPVEQSSPIYGGIGRLLSPVPAAPVLQAEPVAPRHIRRISPWHAMINWLRAPMGSGSRSAA